MSSIRGLQTGQQSRLVPTTGTNAPQCATCWSPEHWSRLLPLTGTIARHEPGPLPFPDEPGPLPSIGPGSEMNREQCLFWAGRKGGLSTSEYEASTIACNKRNIKINQAN